jgi:hypothetical protein
MRPRLPPIALVAAICAASLSGCGTADDRAQARSTVERFYAAVHAQDGATACAQLSEDAAKQVEQQAGKPCPKAIAGVAGKGGRVAGVQVFVTNAKVDLDRESEFLGREPSGWKISALGCRATKGPPTDQPMDCEVQS